MLQDRVEARLMRLLVEILLVVGVSETAVMFLLPVLAPNVSETVGAVMDAGMLTFIAGPVLLWRFMRLARSAEQTDTVSPPESVALPSRNARWQSIFWSGGVVLIGCVLTVSALYFSRESEQRLGQQKFDAQVDRLAGEVVARFVQPVDGLNAIVGLYNTGAVLNQTMFQRFFQSINIPEIFPGVTSFGFVAPQEHSMLVRHVVSVGDGALVTLGGSDIGKIPAARKAMDAAAQNGSAVLSESLVLAVAPRLGSVGAIYFRPAYAVSPRGHGENSKMLAGYAFAAIHFDQILSVVAQQSGGLSHFALLDGQADAPGAVLFDSTAPGGTVDAARADDGGRFVRVVEIKASGHALTIRAHSTAAFEAGLDSSKSMLLGIVLMLTTLFAATATWLLVRGRDRVLVQSLAMASTNERLVKAIQRSNSSVVITNARNEIEWANAAFTSISGYRLDESLGKNLAEMRNVEVSDPRAYARIRSAIRKRQDIRTVLRALTPDGKAYWLDADIQMLQGPQGDYAGFIAVETDISERKQYEKSLEDARIKAEAATQAKGQFLANMSHEIRTPMNAILGMLKLLGRTAMNAQQSDYAGKMEGAARSLLGLINNILDFSKVEAGKMALDIHPIALDLMVRDVATILNANLAGKAIEIRYEVDPALPACVLGDSLRLQQVLVNLGGNAVKFTDSGAVAIAVRLVGVQDRMARIVFSVRDSGIGIAPEHQAMIFDGFSQAEASTTRRFGGTGLGLSISKRLLELMGAQLQLHSTVGQGSTFSFELVLPLGDEKLPPTPPGIDRVSLLQPLAGMRILVVDDNLINQQVAEELLRSEGASVALASDGSLAVDAVATAVPQFDVVLMDLQMPVMDGITATRQIRHRLGLKDLPIVAVTANAQASDRAVCLQVGMNEHVGKPFDLSELVATLLRLTGRQALASAANLPAAAVSVAQDPDLEAALNVVDLSAALARMSGMQSAYLRSARTFLGTLPQAVADFESALQGDHKLAVMQMHTLKGVAATLGVNALSACAAQLEALCRQGADRASILEKVPALQSAVDSALPALLRICEKLAPPPNPSAQASATVASESPPAEASRAQWIAQFQGLQSLLQASDLSALAHYAEWRASLESAPLPQLDVLETALQDLDLDAASRCCDVILATLQEA